MTFREQYAAFLYEMLEQEPIQAPGSRIHNTREILNFSFTLADPEDNLLTGIGRNLNLHIGYLEALQLIGGFSVPQMMFDAQPAFRNYADGGIFHGAYGPRSASQLVAVAEALTTDKHSRRCVVNIWEPLHDTFMPGRKDYPCTVSLIFNVRNNRLHMTTVMRSNDIWLGLPYDVMQFTCLQQTLAEYLSFHLGTYHHVAASMHLYPADVRAAQSVVDAEIDDKAFPESHRCHVNIGQSMTSWVDVQNAARRIATAGDDQTVPMPCEQPFHVAVKYARDKGARVA